ncbi:hypothetical protein B0H13DRAFT_2649365 [Mycena leptocephala]|nr:hypothetical protein B0H13DRAFT_2649365 [Mycena leptocephala]
MSSVAKAGQPLAHHAHAPWEPAQSAGERLYKLRADGRTSRTHQCHLLETLKSWPFVDPWTQSTVRGVDARCIFATGNIYLYTINVKQVTNAIAGDGYILEDVAALVFITQEESTVPLYRLFSATAVDNIYTTSTTERDNAIKNGYTLITVLQAYAYPTQVCGSVPFYHLFASSQNTNFYTASASERLDFIANGYQDMGIAGYVLPVSATQCA